MESNPNRVQRIPKVHPTRLVQLQRNPPERLAFPLKMIAMMIKPMSPGSRGVIHWVDRNWARARAAIRISCVARR